MFWTQRYGARRDVLGRQLVLDDVPFEIIGVMPADFQYPSPDAGFWIPMRLDPRAGGDYWGTNACSTFARLHDGVTPQAAISELRGWTPRVHAMFPWRMPESWGSDVTLEPMREHMVAGVRDRSLLLLGAVALVMLIAIVNLANLMIGQTAARERSSLSRVVRATLPFGAPLPSRCCWPLLAAFWGRCSLRTLGLLKHWRPRIHPTAEVSIDRRSSHSPWRCRWAAGLLFGLLPARACARKFAGRGQRARPGRMGLPKDAVLVASKPRSRRFAGRAGLLLQL